MLTSDLQQSTIDGIVRLYELDASAQGAGVLRFHGDGGADITWQGNAYKSIAIAADGLEIRGDGKASTPTLTIGNQLDGVQGAISALCLRYADFAGTRLTVITTLAKYLDAANFADGNAQASDEHRAQIWFIEQKTSENAEKVAFELSNPVDFGAQRLPAREITSFCAWATAGRYRGEECGYRGIKMFDETGKPTDNPANDRCRGCLADCKARFGSNAPLPFGGFPASNLV